MKITGWILSKCDDTPDGLTPIVASMSLAWHAPMQPPDPTGWMLLQVKCDAGHHAFMKKDEDVIWIGSEWSKVPPALLTTYVDKLDPDETYQNLGQVLDKLGEWDARFLHSLPTK